MNIQYPEKEQFISTLQQTPSNSMDFVVFTTSVFLPSGLEELKIHLDECGRVLKKGGLLFVHGIPEALPELGVYLDRFLNFKYWISVESAPHRPNHGLPSVHAAVLLFSKGRFNIEQVRFPHEYCAFCNKPLRDWGGKTHLMNPNGYAISDVWKGLPSADNYTRISSPVLNTILKMIEGENGRRSNSHMPLLAEINATDFSHEKKGVIGPKEGLGADIKIIAEPISQYYLPGFARPTSDLPSPQEAPTAIEPGTQKWNIVIQGDAVEILKKYPDDSIDLVFADPPYNLDKAYNVYDDEQDRKAYLAWCNAWLGEYTRILKPTGALYVLNLPRWTMYHATFLNQRLYFQNWIVWDALSEPRGKLMPAHYGLLFYTKHTTNFTFNYEAVGKIDARYYCLRQSCIRQRKAEGADDKEPLTDIWADIHRLKHRRDRDYHPCQLPDGLMERIIRLSTNPGDIVLDALAGTGTTAVVAARLGRQYVAIDIDEEYVNITRQKLEEITRLGFVPRQSVPKPRSKYNKKALQLELRDIANQLGHLPTPEDVRKMSRYGPDAFLEAFPSWGKALKAAKLEVENGRSA